MSMKENEEHNGIRRVADVRNWSTSDRWLNNWQSVVSAEKYLNNSKRNCQLNMKKQQLIYIKSSRIMRHKEYFVANYCYDILYILWMEIFSFAICQLISSEFIIVYFKRYEHVCFDINIVRSMTLIINSLIKFVIWNFAMHLIMSI